MGINIERSPKHWCPSQGSNSELFAHENDTLTAEYNPSYKQLKNDLNLV